MQQQKADQLDAEVHLAAVRLGLVRRIEQRSSGPCPPLLLLLRAVFQLPVIDEQQVLRYPSHMRALGNGRIVDQIGVGCPSNYFCYFRSHAMLLGEQRRRQLRGPNQPLEERAVQRIALVGHHGQVVALHLGPQLQVISDQNQVLGLETAHTSQYVSLQDFARFLHQHHVRPGVIQQILVLGCARCCGADHPRLCQDLLEPVLLLRVQVVLQLDVLQKQLGDFAARFFQNILPPCCNHFLSLDRCETPYVTPRQRQAHVT